MKHRRRKIFEETGSSTRDEARLGLLPILWKRSNESMPLGCGVEECNAK